MNLTTIMVGLNDLKVKINRFYPKKIVLSIIREDVFLYIYIYIYISFEIDYKSSSFCYSVFLMRTFISNLHV